MLKFLAIYFVYLGHFHVNVDRIHLFVYQFHIPLFFFASGCTYALSDPKTRWIDFFKKNVRQILLPFAFFVFLSGLFDAFYYNLNQHDAWLQFTAVFTGSGVPAFAPSAWFLPCLFVMRLVFDALRRAIPSKLALTVLCVLLGLVGYQFLYTTDQPWFWNVNNIPFWMLFYCLGYTFFPAVDAFCTRPLRSPRRRALLWAACIVCLVYASTLYFGETHLANLLGGVPFSGPPVTVVNALCGIACTLMFAKKLQNCTLFQRIGRNTLYLCGCEHMVRLTTGAVLTWLHLSEGGANPLMTCLYVLGLVIVASEILIVPIKKLWAGVPLPPIPVSAAPTAPETVDKRGKTGIE